MTFRSHTELGHWRCRRRDTLHELNRSHSTLLAECLHCCFLIFTHNQLKVFLTYNETDTINHEMKNVPMNVLVTIWCKICLRKNINIVVEVKQNISQPGATTKCISYWSMNNPRFIQRFSSQIVILVSEELRGFHIHHIYFNYIAS